MENGWGDEAGTAGAADFAIDGHDGPTSDELGMPGTSQDPSCSELSSLVLDESVPAAVATTELARHPAAQASCNRGVKVECGINLVTGQVVLDGQEPYWFAEAPVADYQPAICMAGSMTMRHESVKAIQPLLDARPTETRPASEVAILADGQSQPREAHNGWHACFGDATSCDEHAVVTGNEGPVHDWCPPLAAMIIRQLMLM